MQNRQCILSSLFSLLLNQNKPGENPLIIITENPDMKIIRLSVLLLLHILLAQPILADKLDSLRHAHDTSSIYFFYHHIDSLARQKLNPVNPSNLKGFQRYNPLETDPQLFYATTGNIGLAHNPMFHKPFVSAGFDFGIHSFDQYTYHNNNTKYIFYDTPVTNLSYFNGSQKEQYFKVKHSQQIAKLITVGADLYYLNAPGFYVRQETNNRSVVFTAQYFTDNDRYGIIANYYHNKFEVEENGGIQNDSVFEENLEPNRKQIAVNLNTAENLVKESGVGMSQYFSLAKPVPKNDTTALKNLKVFHFGKISHDFNYNRKIQIYTDQEPASEFYHPFDSILDSAQTFDSVFISTIENQFSWSNLRIGSEVNDKVIYVRFGLKHQYTEISGYTEKRYFNQLIPNAEIELHPHATIDLNFTGNFTIGDFNSNGFYLGGKYLHRFDYGKRDLGRLSAEVFLLNQEKGWFYSEYHSNYLRWNNDFKKERMLSINANYTLKRLQLGVAYQTTNNFVYLGLDAKPVQHDQSLNVLAINLKKDFQFGKFGWDNTIIYQQTSDKSVLRLPEWTALVSVYFTLPMFQNAIIFQPGLDFYYYTAYFADTYMPSTRSFYIQNEKEIGNHLYADIYLNLVLKRFRFFLKYQHLNSAFGNYDYYTVPHYPMNDASLKFGLSWNFYE